MNSDNQDRINDQNTTSQITDLTEPVSWQAPEVIKSHRGTGWYIGFAIIFVALEALAILVLKSWTFAILLPVMAVALFVLGRDNGDINYAISPKGVYVADKLYDFSEFRGFGLTKENGHHAVVLLPVKRFSPGLTIYFPEETGERIVDMLGARLPMQEIKTDLLSEFVRLIKL